MRETTDVVEGAGFVVLRTPLLPIDEWLSFGEGLTGAAAVDRAILRERLVTLCKRPDIREALFVASPTLESRLDGWMASPDSEDGVKVERSIVRYFSRMTGRSTPFGLFAGTSLGRIGAELRIRIERADRDRRHTRLDMGYLCALAEALARRAEVRRHVVFRPSSSLYVGAGKIRYAEALTEGRTRSYQLVGIDASPAVRIVLERARAGATLAELADALCVEDPEVAPEEAATFVNDLVDAQLLVGDLAAAVTGPAPVEQLVADLSPIPAATEARDVLSAACADLAALDADGIGVAPARYRAIAESLKVLPASVELSRLFQVDLAKAAEVSIGAALLDEIAGAAVLLHRVAPARRDPLASFRAAFVARYEEREVPLLEALDPESGIGFEPANTPVVENAPLLDGISFFGAPEAPAPWTPRHEFLLARLANALRKGALEIGLEEADVNALSDPLAPRMPDSCGALVTLLSQAGAEPRILLHSTFGPSGATMLGRFCNAEPALRAAVVEQLRVEEAQRPDVIHCEIVHLPEGRLGNIVCRPLLRRHELAFLGRSGAPRESQLALDDLFVSCTRERVILRSARLGKEIVPRLSNAHNFRHPTNLAVYRFLGALQLQDGEGTRWSWGPLAGSPFLPRVTAGRVVLSPARWRLDRQALETLGGPDPLRATWELRREVGLPRHVAIARVDGLAAESGMFVDLENALSVDSFAQMAKSRSSIEVVETFLEEQTLARGADGTRFAHELVVPLARRCDPQPTQEKRLLRHESTKRRSFTPGDEWLYCKWYCAPSTADELLAGTIGPIAREAIHTGAADRWFFVRYEDPEKHLRIRFRGASARLTGELLPVLHRAGAVAMSSGRVWRIQLDTYEREVERYGGPAGIELCESIFHADSEAALTLLEGVDRVDAPDVMWRLALVGMDRLLTDLGFDLATKHRVLQGRRDDFRREHGVDALMRRQLGDKFREQRASLEELLSAPPDAFRVRSSQIRSVAESLRAAERAGELGRSLERIAAALLHMHANRTLRSAARAQELVIYDLLERLYDARLARARKQGGVTWTAPHR